LLVAAPAAPTGSLQATRRAAHAQYVRATHSSAQSTHRGATVVIRALGSCNKRRNSRVNTRNLAFGKNSYPHGSRFRSPKDFRIQAPGFTHATRFGHAAGRRKTQPPVGIAGPPAEVREQRALVLPHPVVAIKSAACM